MDKGSAGSLTLRASVSFYDTGLKPGHNSVTELPNRTDPTLETQMGLTPSLLMPRNHVQSQVVSRVSSPATGSSV